MFEFLMLIGFLGAGLSHWQPRRAASESAGSGKRSRGKSGGEDAKVKDKDQPRKAMMARIAAA